MAVSSQETKKSKTDYLFDVDFKKYYIVLSQQKKFILVFCCSAMLTSLVLTYFFSEKYVAGTSIYYHPIETSHVRWKDTQAFGSPAPAPPFKVIVQTLRDIIISDTILMPVVDNLHLDQPVKRVEGSWLTQFYDSAKDKIKGYGLKLWSILKYGRVIELKSASKAVVKLRDNIKIMATKESYVYVITVKDQFPTRAAAIVDELAADLVAWLKKQDVDTAANRLEQIGKQLQEKDLHLNALRASQESALMENNLAEVSEELSRIIENLYGIESEHINITAEIERKKETISSYKRALKLKTVNKMDPKDLKRIESSVIFEGIDLNSLISQKTSLKLSMDDLKKRMQQMLTTKTQIESIDMQIEADTRVYTHLKDMYLENLSQVSAGASEVEVMHEASIPAEPVQPVKIYHVGLAGLLSLFFSAGLIYMFAFFNVRLFFASRGTKGRDN